MIIDSHAHLDYPQLADDLPAILARAHEAGVDRVITIGVKLTTVDRPRALAEANDNIWFSAGGHPHEAGRKGKGLAAWSRPGHLVSGLSRSCGPFTVS